MKTTLRVLALVALSASLLAATTACNDTKLAAGSPGDGPGGGGGGGGNVTVNPVAVILVSAGGATAITLDGSSSFDPDDTTAGAVVEYTWALASAPAGAVASVTGNGATAMLATDTPGNHTVTLVVKDREALLSAPALYEVAWLPIEIDGDCETITCPASSPYPVACDIEMDGGDERGCVSSSPSNSVVYFQEGDVCGSGHVEGTLLCSTQPGLALDAATCPINKSQPFYPTAPTGCPALN